MAIQFLRFKIKPFMKPLWKKTRFVLVFFRGFLKLFFLTCFAAILSSIIFFSSFRFEGYRERISTEISKKIGYTVQIKGKISADIKNFRPVIDLKDIQISDDKNHRFADIGRLYLSIDLGSLFLGEIRFNDLFLNRVNLYLPLPSSDKIQTLVKADAKADFEMPFGLPLKASIQTLNLKSFSIFDEKSSSVFSMPNLTLNLDFNEIHSDLDGDFTLEKETYHLMVQTIGLTELLKSDSFPVSIQLSHALGQISVQGQMGYPLSSFLTTGHFSATSSHLNTFLSGFKITSINSPIRFESDFAISSDFARFSNLNLKVKKSDFSGDGYVLFNQNRPFVRFNLSSALFDIPNAFPDSPRATPSHKIPVYVREKRDPKAFIGVKFPVEFFNQFDAHLKLNLKKLKPMTTMTIGPIDLEATLNKGQAVLHKTSTRYAGGNVILHGLIDVSDHKTLRTELALEGENISVGEIVSMSGGGHLFDPDTSLATIEIALKGQGATLAQLMGSLDGVGKVYTQKKTRGYGIAPYFLGQDLLSSLVDEFKEKGKDLDINCVAGHVRVHKGIAITQKSIALESDKINMVVEGSVDLGKEKTDISMVSLPVSGLRLGLSDFLSLVKIEGPMARSKFTISGSKMIERGTQWAVATGVASVLTGGITALAAGIGFLGKSWLDSFWQDEHPCESALNAKYIDEDLENPTKTPVKGLSILLNQKVNSLTAYHKKTFKNNLKQLRKSLEKKKYVKGL